MSFAAQKLCFSNVSYYFTDTPRTIKDTIVPRTLFSNIDLLPCVAVHHHHTASLFHFRSSINIMLIRAVNLKNGINSSTTTLGEYIAIKYIMSAYMSGKFSIRTAVAVSNVCMNAFEYDGIRSW